MDNQAKQQTFQIDESGRIVSTTSEKLNAFVDQLVTEKTQSLQAEITRLTALVESYKVDVERWQDLTNFGQISVGDKLKFTTSGKLVEMKAEEILYAGNHLEEVIYNSKNNYYFLTSMAVKNMSHAKNVQFSKSIDADMKGKG